MGEKLKRQYLSSEEENLFMMMASLSMHINGKTEVRKNFMQALEERGMLTKETKRELKMMNTYLNKYLQHTFDMLDETTQIRLKKRLAKFNYKIIDDYQLKRILKSVQEQMKNVTITRSTFEDLIEDIAEVRCKNCTNSYKDCEVYKAMYDALLDAPGLLPNCPYAWNDK